MVQPKGFEPKSLSGKESTKAKAFGDAICFVWDKKKEKKKTQIYSKLLIINWIDKVM